jgi:DNA polymerase-3 subunit alpha
LPGIGFQCEEENLPEWDEELRLRNEKEAVGFFLSSHPLRRYRQETVRLGLVNLEDTRDFSAGSQINVAILVNDYREITTRKGKRMAFVGVEDLTAVAEVTFFQEELIAARALLTAEQPLVLTAIVERRENSNAWNKNGQPADTDDESEETPHEIRLRAISVQLLSSACRDSEIPYCLQVNSSSISKSRLQELKVLLEKYSGNTEFHLALTIDNKRCIVAFGQRWRVSPGPALYNDLARWQSQ